VNRVEELLGAGKLSKTDGLGVIQAGKRASEK
jgi:hypothetical protein